MQKTQTNHHQQPSSIKRKLTISYQCPPKTQKGGLRQQNQNCQTLHHNINLNQSLKFSNSIKTGKKRCYTIKTQVDEKPDCFIGKENMFREDIFKSQQRHVKKTIPLLSISNNYNQNIHQDQKRSIVQIEPFYIQPQNSHFKTQNEKIKKKQKKQFNITDFITIKHLGKGKFGTVSLVKHKKTNFICAMKAIEKKTIRQQKVEHQILKQLKIHNKLRHLNIISFYGFFYDATTIYILTQYAAEGDLYSKIKKSMRLSEEETKQYVKQTSEGLRIMHTLGFLHRDIKPENLLTQFGNLKICDLGWASQCGKNQMRKSSCGTPLYYSPQLVNRQSYNSQIDVWSLGILAYELIIGRIPFRIWSQFDLHVITKQEVQFPDYVDVSPECKDFILKCLKKDQKQRMKMQQVRKHPFFKNSQNSAYFNLELYAEIEKILY